MKLLPLSFFLLASLGSVVAEEAAPPADPKKDVAAPAPVDPGPPPAGAPGEGPGSRRGGGPNREAMEAQWKKADLDGDGFLTEAEFALLPRIANLPEDKRSAIFHRIDKDGDGKISPEEMRQSRPRPPAFPPLDQVDLDKDGKISFEEFQKVPFVAKQSEERQHAMFDRMDRDKDGFLTPKDGPLTPPGGGPGGRGGRHGFDPKKFIQDLDTNGDGSLSFEEFRKAPFIKDLGEDAQEAKFNEMDRNKDLKIDLSDFPAPPDRGPGPPPEDGKPDGDKPPGAPSKGS
ncbi:MAG: calcium-binding allergen Ole e 8 [Akkermansiaceae bacterium]|nr:calcium-binding allergen Ole e 8 [Akkermansiaceae bacterium]